jgi:subtilisin family serine protease
MTASPSRMRGLTAVLIGWLAACSVDDNAPPLGGGARNAAAAGDKANAAAVLPSKPSGKLAALRIVPGEYLVKFRAPTGRAYAASALSASGLNVKRTFVSVPGLHHVVAAPGVEPSVAAAQLARRPDVEYVEPNFIVHATATPDDPLFPRLWALHNTGQLGGTSTVYADIGALAAWDITTGDPSVVIAVIDTGTDYTHPDLAANIWVNQVECNNNGLDNDGDGYVNDCHGINAITHSGDPMDDYFHGTHVAGTIGAVGNNAVGVTGVNWHVTLLPCKFLDSTGTGTTGDAITCFDYIALKKDHGVNVIASNNSWGGGAYSQALADAIVAQRTRGILVIAAAGNDSFDNDQLPTHPCSYDLSNIICVAAAVDSVLIFSNYGIGTVHLAAPGLGILSTVPKGGYDTFDGTSMATPHVTGVVALLKAQDPTRDWRALKNLVLAGTVPPTQGRIPTLTGGRLRADNSLTCSNSIVEARMRPALFETITLGVGASLPLEAININCANPNGNVVVTVGPTGETVTLHDDGISPDEVAADGIYSGAWTASAPGSYTLTFPGRAGDVVNVEVDAMLRPGFPTKMFAQPDADGVVRPPLVSLVVGNIDADPQLEILAPGYGAGPLYAWKADGTPVPGWPNYQVTATSQVSLGNFGGSSGVSGIVAGFFLDGLHLYNGDGSAVAGWPQPTTNLWYPAPTIDVDGDGIDEIIGYPARHADGTLVNTSVTIPVKESIGDPPGGSAAVADLDADGQPDFVVANSQRIWASNAQGLLAEFPVPTPYGAGDVFFYPVIGDVDGNGKPNIILPTGCPTSPPGAEYLGVNILTNEGVLERTLCTTEPVTNQVVALADLDGDGIPEIIASTGSHVYAWKGDGTPMPGWPASLGAGTLAGPAVVGDVDGGGYPDIVLVSGTYINGALRLGLLHALDRFGKPLPGFPKPIQSVVTATAPVIADLDGTGHNEIIVSYTPDVGLRDTVFVYDLHGTGLYGPIEWGQYMGGANHRGYYETGKNLPNDAFLTAQAHGAGTIASSDGGINCGATCIHKYPKGTTVTLTATAGSGAVFSHWLGPCAAQANPCIVAVTRYTPVAADFTSPVTVAVTGAGTVASTPAGINCPAATCTATFPARTQVTLTVSATAGSVFNGWGGACSGIASSCTLTIDAAKSVSAQFVDHRALTLAFSGSGKARVVSTPTGIDCGATCVASFPPGAVVTLTSTPGPDTYLANWGLPGCFQGGTCVVTMSADVSGVVTLALKPTIALSVNGGGSVVLASNGASTVTCTSSCTQPWDPGSLVQLTPVAASGTYFTAWGGDCSGTPSTINSCSLTLDASKTVSVNFAPKLHVAVAVTGTGQGVVGSSDGLLSCPPACADAVAGGALLTLTANPSSGSTFSGWSGACSGSQPSCTLTVNASTSVGASFAAPPGSGNGGSSSGGSNSGSGGGGGALDLLSLVALAGVAASRRASRHHRPGSCYVGKSAPSFAE